MTSAESGSLKFLFEQRELQEEKIIENARFAEDYNVESKSRSQGISLNDLVQLHSPIRHGYVRYIGEIPNINQHCDFFGIALCGKYKKMGKHDGTFRGIKFFTTSDKSGIFCKRHKVKKVLKRSALSVINTPSKLYPLTDAKKLQFFSRTVKTLSGWLSTAHLDLDGASVSFGSEKADRVSRCSTPDSYESSRFHKLVTRHDTLGRILKAPMSTEQSEDLKLELEEDFALYAVSRGARESLKSKQDVKELIKNLQICINVLKTHIPTVTKMLDANDLDNTVYMTNVIQDLLKRAQNEKLSKKILTDFTGIRSMNYVGANAFSRSDIAALVETMAWIRNNLCIAGLTDENDAMMTLMGAEEVQQSLVGILKKLDFSQVLGAARRPSVPIGEPSLDIKKQSGAEGPNSPLASV